MERVRKVGYFDWLKAIWADGETKLPQELLESQERADKIGEDLKKTPKRAKKNGSYENSGKVEKSQTKTAKNSLEKPKEIDDEIIR